MQKVINILVFVCPWRGGPKDSHPAGQCGEWSCAGLHFHNSRTTANKTLGRVDHPRSGKNEKSKTKRSKFRRTGIYAANINLPHTHTQTHSSESCRINPSKGTRRQGHGAAKWSPTTRFVLGQQEVTTKLISRTGDRDRRANGRGKHPPPPSAATPTFASTVWALAAGQPQPGKSAENSRVRTRRATQKNAACTSVSRRKVPIPILVLAILFIFSQAALYLSAAVLVGEIVCNHENLISAQICWHCANVFYGPSRSNFRQFSSVWLGSATRKGAAPSLKMTDCWSGGLGP